MSFYDHARHDAERHPAQMLFQLQGVHGAGGGQTICLACLFTSVQDPFVLSTCKSYTIRLFADLLQQHPGGQALLLDMLHSHLAFTTSSVCALLTAHSAQPAPQQQQAQGAPPSAHAATDPGVLSATAHLAMLLAGAAPFMPEALVQGLLQRLLGQLHGSARAHSLTLATHWPPEALSLLTSLLDDPHAGRFLAGALSAHPDFMQLLSDAVTSPCDPLAAASALMLSVALHQHPTELDLTAAAAAALLQQCCRALAGSGPAGAACRPQGQGQPRQPAQVGRAPDEGHMLLLIGILQALLASGSALQDPAASAAADLHLAGGGSASQLLLPSMGSSGAGGGGGARRQAELLMSALRACLLSPSAALRAHASTACATLASSCPPALLAHLVDADLCEYLFECLRACCGGSGSGGAGGGGGGGGGGGSAAAAHAGASVHAALPTLAALHSISQFESQRCIAQHAPFGVEVLARLLQAAAEHGDMQQQAAVLTVLRSILVSPAQDPLRLPSSDLHQLLPVLSRCFPEPGSGAAPLHDLSPEAQVAVQTAAQILAWACQRWGASACAPGRGGTGSDAALGELLGRGVRASVQGLACVAGPPAMLRAYLLAAAEALAAWFHACAAALPTPSAAAMVVAPAGALRSARGSAVRGTPAHGPPAGALLADPALQLLASLDLFEATFLPELGRCQAAAALSAAMPSMHAFSPSDDADVDGLASLELAAIAALCELLTWGNGLAATASPSGPRLRAAMSAFRRSMASFGMCRACLRLLGGDCATSDEALPVAWQALLQLGGGEGGDTAGVSESATPEAMGQQQQQGAAALAKELVAAGCRDMHGAVLLVLRAAEGLPSAPGAGPAIRRLGGAGGASVGPGISLACCHGVLSALQCCLASGDLAASGDAYRWLRGALVEILAACRLDPSAFSSSASALSAAASGAVDPGAAGRVHGSGGGPASGQQQLQVRFGLFDRCLHLFILAEQQEHQLQQQQRSLGSAQGWDSQGGGGGGGGGGRHCPPSPVPLAEAERLDALVHDYLQCAVLSAAAAVPTVAAVQGKGQVAGQGLARGQPGMQDAATSDGQAAGSGGVSTEIWLWVMKHGQAGLVRSAHLLLLSSVSSSPLPQALDSIAFLLLQHPPSVLLPLAALQQWARPGQGAGMPVDRVLLLLGLVVKGLPPDVLDMALPHLFSQGLLDCMRLLSLHHSSAASLRHDPAAAPTLLACLTASLQLLRSALARPVVPDGCLDPDQQDTASTQHYGESKPDTCMAGSHDAVGSPPGLPASCVVTLQAAARQAVASACKALRALGAGQGASDPAGEADRVSGVVAASDIAARCLELAAVLVQQDLLSYQQGSTPEAATQLLQSPDLHQAVHLALSQRPSAWHGSLDGASSSGSQPLASALQFLSLGLCAEACSVVPPGTWTTAAAAAQQAAQQQQQQQVYSEASKLPASSEPDLEALLEMLASALPAAAPAVGGAGAGAGPPVAPLLLSALWACMLLRISHPGNLSSGPSPSMRRGTPNVLLMLLQNAACSSTSVATSLDEPPSAVQSRSEALVALSLIPHYVAAVSSAFSSSAASTSASAASAAAACKWAPWNRELLRQAISRLCAAGKRTSFPTPGSSSGLAFCPSRQLPDLLFLCSMVQPIRGRSLLLPPGQGATPGPDAPVPPWVLADVADALRSQDLLAALIGGTAPAGDRRAVGLQGIEAAAAAALCCRTCCWLLHAGLLDAHLPRAREALRAALQQQEAMRGQPAADDDSGAGAVRPGGADGTLGLGGMPQCMLAALVAGHGEGQQQRAAGAVGPVHGAGAAHGAGQRGQSVLPMCVEMACSAKGVLQAIEQRMARVGGGGAGAGGAKRDGAETAAAPSTLVGVRG